MLALLHIAPNSPEKLPGLDITAYVVPEYAAQK